MRMAPLSGAFTMVSILGFMLFSIFTMYGKIDKTWGFTMMIFFFICVVAAYVSIYPTVYKQERLQQEKSKDRTIPAKHRKK